MDGGITKGVHWVNKEDLTERMPVRSFYPLLLSYFIAIFSLNNIDWQCVFLS